MVVTSRLVGIVRLLTLRRQVREHDGHQEAFAGSSGSVHLEGMPI